MEVKVRGVEMYSERGTLLPDETFVLEQDFGNTVDPNAVKVLRVYTDTGRRSQVGYIQQECAEDVSALMAKNHVNCVVVPPLNPVEANMRLTFTKK
jgi:hypothetical protein